MTHTRTILALAAATIVAAVAAPGGDTPKKAAPTFAADIAPILYAKCASCHHPGEVAPFSLMTYQDAKNMAPTIAAVVKKKYMPPWQAVSHGEFMNERTLTDDQIATLERWASNGAPAGDLKKAPKPPTYTPGWQMGTPDFVGKPDRPYEITADGSDDYRCFVIPTSFAEDRFVTGIEVKPGNRRVVHHVLIYVDSKGIARKKGSPDGKPGYESFGGPGFAPTGSLGGWAPGLQPQVLDDTNGFLLPKGADIVLQVHYHKDGKPETDLTQIGLKFAKGKVDKEVRWQDVGEEVFAIPAGDPAYPVTATRKLNRAVTLLDIIPHMHLLGHDMTVVATLPDGTKKQLIQVENYDFNWQTRYAFRDPVHLPAGTVISLVAHYDNSANNLRNPFSPPQKVTFGEQTTNEMCYAFFSYTFDEEHLAKGIQIKDNFSADTEAINHIFDKFDEDHDGFLDLKEVTAVIKFFNENGGKTGGVSPEQAAQFVVAAYGKTQKGKLTRAEFTKLATQNGGK